MQPMGCIDPLPPPLPGLWIEAHCFQVFIGRGSLQSRAAIQVNRRVVSAKDLQADFGSVDRNAL